MRTLSEARTDIAALGVWDDCRNCPAPIAPVLLSNAARHRTKLERNVRYQAITAQVSSVWMAAAARR